ncbi:hypothetical protein ABMA27_013202 [Loxostege sticticalis]|uniref:CRAL-TRIO domain-containing protein n=1 Tax=Loxostege sticticalis TaxID=481309 RepID=A0ABR3IEH1_LOXSC
MSIRALAPELAEKAREQFQEDPERLQDALQEIRNWLALQPHIHARTDDQWLVAYIRGCKFNLEKVKTKLDLFYTCRHTCKDFYQLHHKDEKFKELMASGFYLPLPKLSNPAAPRVTLLRIGVFDIAKIGAVNAFAAAHVVDKILMVDDDNAIIAGNIVIIDFKGTTLLHLVQLTPIQMRMLIASQQDALPFSSASTFIVINVPKGLNEFIIMVKKLLNATEEDQFCTYSENYEEIYTLHGLTRDIMPVEYGGNGGTLQEFTDHWVRKIEEYSEWLEEDLQFGTDESKRPGMPRTTESMFGEPLPKDRNFLQNLNL